LGVCGGRNRRLAPAELGEQLSWFLEVLDFPGADVDEAIKAMEKHFDFD